MGLLLAIIGGGFDLVFPFAIGRYIDKIHDTVSAGEKSWSMDDDEIRLLCIIVGVVTVASIAEGMRFCLMSKRSEKMGNSMRYDLYYSYFNKFLTTNSEGKEVDREQSTQ